MNLEDGNAKPIFSGRAEASAEPSGVACAEQGVTTPVPLHRQPKIAVYDSFEPVQRLWTSFERKADAFAFQTYGWLKNWYKFVGVHQHITPCITVVEAPEGVPVMLLPLGVERSGLASRLIWLGGRVSDYRGPLLARDCSSKLDMRRFHELWRDIRARLPAHDVVFLENQAEFIDDQRNPFFNLQRSPHVTNAYSTRLGPTLDAFLQSKRGGRWLRDERRKERRLAEAGPVAFRIASNPQEISCMLAAMMEQKSRSYRELAVTDLFDEPGCREFFEHMSKYYIGEGLVHLSVLTVNEEIKAAHWGLVYRGRFYCLLPTYARDALVRFSPGNILLRRLFEWCIAQGVERFDFTIGDEAYKDDWCDQELRMFDTIAAANLRGWLYVTPLQLTRAVKRVILSSPRLRAPARSLRIALGRMRSG